jgi:hypothetical protein
MLWKALKDTFKEVADKTTPRERERERERKKRTKLDVPRHVEGHGEQAKNENGRKLGQSKKTKWRNTKKNQERQGKPSKEKMQGAGRAQ